MNEIWKAGELLLPPEGKGTSHCYQRQPWYPVAAPAPTDPTNIVREQESLETGSKPSGKCGADATSSTLELTTSSSSTGSSGGCCGSKQNRDRKARIVSYEEAPEHLQFNPFIRTGYRTYLSMRLCLESVFWWTNETVNIWSHIFGLFVFVALAYNDLEMLQIQAGPSDRLIVGMLLFSFQVCMILSSVYHTFSCHSATSYDRLLTFDLFGIALSLLAIFMSGIYYAFWCNLPLRNFYMLTIGVIFAGAMILQIPRLQVPSHLKMVAFVAWAAYGIVPTLHWYYVMGGAESTMVQLFIPRVLVMYALSGVAFLIYVAKIPERWYVGRFDCIGHSHNLWHIIVLAALYYWHNSGMKYVEFRMIHGCAAGVQMA
ncbi:progestin and adipoQ receptor family member 3-like isoform X2 [Anopheles albimanus]|uniref:progestin and adipoQ receptor family member 3-like isoform X2 n=1 Tax=Anopheles albimanus TaxID=7167 RepID=UPI001641B95D|nr:progestin and adipoQ receptor family member 3-like isoform X2 [Anopheles albimanus]